MIQFITQIKYKLQVTSSYKWFGKTQGIKLMECVLGVNEFHMKQTASINDWVFPLVSDM